MLNERTETPCERAEQQAQTKRERDKQEAQRQEARLKCAADETAATVGLRRSRGSGIDPPSAALTTAHAASRFRDRHVFRQGVDVDVPLMLTSFTLCDDGADAVLAHIA